MTTARLKRFVFVLLFVSAVTGVQAQVLKAKVGINGLTCSQCSRSVEMQLRKLPFVKSVDMDLEHTEGSLFFKEGMKVDFSKIAKAVKDAGFSLRFLKAEFDMSKVEVNDKGFRLSNDWYLLSDGAPVHADKARFVFLGSNYSSQKMKSINAARPRGTGNTYNVALIPSL